jgi:hypothetical protein
MADEPREVERTIAMARPAQARPATELDEVGHYLVVLEGGEPGRRIPLGQAPLTIGREAGRGLVLVDTEVSRFHLQLAVVGDAVVVEDRQSTNGTFIDGPVRTDWRYQPSAILGGDALGYDWLDEDTFVVYLIDVSGHGVGAAMHSVGVMNVLRQHALSAATVREPAAALAAVTIGTAG